ncbi:hypothetical protein AY599_26540 [Leptolyngbya valderiana BDU 20041]|nr:hypothetical protein [Geitlerinema sp. CS-897]OAB61519.1 hypothetical protein AY599_26540 [Leptolyngbya valderiana BDU 20041]PPT06814.1 hypothetical protein CKA32_003431 [Geitlerinema sp. FC II]
MFRQALLFAAVIVSQTASSAIAIPRSILRSQYRDVEVSTFTQRYDIVAGNLHDIAAQLLETGDSLEGRQRETLEIEYPSGDRDYAVIEYTQIGLADDSVGSIHHRLELQSSPSGWIVEWVGARYQCARGDNPNAWTNELCP